MLYPIEENLDDNLSSAPYVINDNLPIHSFSSSIRGFIKNNERSSFANSQMSDRCMPKSARHDAPIRERSLLANSQIANRSSFANSQIANTSTSAISMSHRRY